MSGLSADLDGLGFFETELVQMTLMGNTPLGPVTIQESPTLQSLGGTTITQIGPGQFQISSFFDIFTELSLDGGPFIPQERGPSRVTLVPAPAALLLLGVGAVGVLGRRLLRRQTAA